MTQFHFSETKMPEILTAQEITSQNTLRTSKFYFKTDFMIIYNFKSKNVQINKAMPFLLEHGIF